MLTIKSLREEKEKVVERLKIKNFDAKEIVEEILSLDAAIRKTRQELDEILSRSNRLAKEIGQLYKTGQRQEAEEKKAETAALKTKSSDLKEKLSALQQSFESLMLKLPNLPHISVPAGKAKTTTLWKKKTARFPSFTPLPNLIGI